MDPIDRRRVLGGAAVGASLVWVAPVVLSVDAAAAATLPPQPDFENAFGDFGNPGAPPITVTLPFGQMVDGDLLIAIGAIRFSDSKDAGIDPPAGFAPIVPAASPPPLTPGGVTSQPTPIAPSPEALRAWVWSKTWHTGDPLSYDFTKTLASGSPTRWSAGILVFHGSSGVGAADGQGQVASTVTAPSITTSGASRTLIYVGVSAGPTTWSSPVGFTVLGQGPTNPGNPEGLVASTIQPLAGPSGPVTATASLPSDPAEEDNIGFLLELLP